MANERDVWVFVEQEEGKIADVSLELLAKGQELARTLKGQVCGLLCGYEMNDLAQTAIHHGADRVLLADHPELEVYRTLPYAKVTTAAFSNSWAWIADSFSLEISSASHPFYTGKRKFVDTTGRVERFREKYNYKDAE